MASVNLDGILHTLPNFDGKKETNLEFFLSQFDQLATEIKISDTLKLILLKSKLSGTVRDLLLNTTELREELNYDNFKKKLKENFQTKYSFEDIQEKFMSLKQTPEQTIDEFAKTLNIAAAKYLQFSGHADKEGAKEFLNLMKFTRFIDGIRPDIAFEIRKSGKKNFEEALEKAKSVEMAQKAMNKEIINNITKDETKLLCDSLLAQNKNHNEEINTLKEEIRKLKLNQNEKTKTVYCDICKVTSHDTDSCWYNAKKDNKQIQRIKNQANYSHIHQRNFQQHQYPHSNVPTYNDFQNSYGYTPLPQTSQQYQLTQYTQTQPNNLTPYRQNAQYSHQNQNQYRYRDNSQQKRRTQNGRRGYFRGTTQRYNNKSPMITYPQEN